MSAVMHAGARRHGGGDRALQYAVLLSLAFHGALLFSFTLRASGSRPSAPPPLTAHLVPQPAAPTVAPPPEPAPRPRVEPPPRPLVKPVPKPVPVPRPASKVATPPPQPAPQPLPQAAPAPQPATASPPTQPSAPPSPVARVEPRPAAPSAVETDALQAYRSELIEMAKRYKRYPRVAMDNNWEGRVVVRMVVGANGMIGSIQVMTSSGQKVLDQQAQEMIQRAKGRVQIPAGLRGKEFAIEIPVTYSLKEGETG